MDSTEFFLFDFAYSHGQIVGARVLFVCFVLAVLVSLVKIGKSI